MSKETLGRRNLYQTIIHGDVIGNVATGSHAVQTTGNIKVNKGDLETLRKLLGDWGIAKAGYIRVSQIA